MPVTSADLAATLLRRQRERRAELSQRALRLRQILNAEVTELLRQGTLRRAWLIGSLAWGTFGERSDVDVVVEGLPDREATQVGIQLGDRLGAVVDLLRLEELPATFRRRVLEEGLPLDVA